jgi:hypothetical protein
MLKNVILILKRSVTSEFDLKYIESFNHFSMLIKFTTSDRSYINNIFHIPFNELRGHYKDNLVLFFHNKYIIISHERLSPFLQDNLKREKFDTLTGKIGESCDDVCSKHGKKCLESHFDYINNCKTLMKNFDCQECRLQYGPDIPNFVNDPTNHLNKLCLVTHSVPSTCSAHHKSTQRICPCVK